MRRAVPWAAVALVALALHAGERDQAYVVFEDAALAEGRALWLANCEGCHGYGTAGAPVPMRPGDWEGRIARGMPVLYRHAIEGFFGPGFTMMPERGGNPDLSDEQVKAAVDYMVALARHHSTKEQNR